MPTLWACPTCTLHNVDGVACAACGCAHPSRLPKAAIGPVIVIDDDDDGVNERARPSRSSGGYSGTCNSKGRKRGRRRSPPSVRRALPASDGPAAAPFSSLATAAVVVAGSVAASVSSRTVASTTAASTAPSPTSSPATTATVTASPSTSPSTFSSTSSGTPAVGFHLARDAGLVTTEDLDRCFAALVHFDGWRELVTRSGASRLVVDVGYADVSFGATASPSPTSTLGSSAPQHQQKRGRLRLSTGGGQQFVPSLPSALVPARPVFEALLAAAQQHGQGEAVMPLQCFVCLYRDGHDTCPPHRHDCRQLTLSLGATRSLTVNHDEAAGRTTGPAHHQRTTTRDHVMQHGDAIILDGQTHAVPERAAAAATTAAPRVSINLFFATASDFITNRQGRGKVSVPAVSRRPRKHTNK